MFNVFRKIWYKFKFSGKIKEILVQDSNISINCKQTLVPQLHSKCAIKSRIRFDRSEGRLRSSPVASIFPAPAPSVSVFTHNSQIMPLNHLCFIWTNFCIILFIRRIHLFLNGALLLHL